MKKRAMCSRRALFLTTCALMLASAFGSTASAQQQVLVVPATSQQVVVEPEAPLADAAETPRGARAAAELGVTILSLGVGVGVGAGLGYALGADQCDRPFFEVCLRRHDTAWLGGFGGLLAGAALSPLLVNLVGGGLDGRGNRGGAYLGLLAGSAVAMGLVGLGGLIREEMKNDTGEALFGVFGVVGGIIALLGPTLGYELFDALARSRDLSITPTASVSPDGFGLGLEGEF